MRCMRAHQRIHVHVHAATCAHCAARVGACQDAQDARRARRAVVQGACSHRPAHPATLPPPQADTDCPGMPRKSNYVCMHVTPLLRGSSARALGQESAASVTRMLTALGQESAASVTRLVTRSIMLFFCAVYSGCRDARHICRES
jgi:hypothetical protein